jgi:hypothetical protein
VIEHLTDFDPKENVEFRPSENNNLKETIGDITAMSYL